MKRAQKSLGVIAQVRRDCARGTDPKGPEVGLRALFALVAACEALEPLDPEADYDDLQGSATSLNDELDRIRALAAAVRLDILDKAPTGLD